MHDETNAGFVGEDGETTKELVERSGGEFPVTAVTSLG
jgi:hypothetical protein